MFGVCTSLGLGAMQFNKGLQRNFGEDNIEFSAINQVLPQPITTRLAQPGREGRSGDHHLGHHGLRHGLRHERTLRGHPPTQRDLLWVIKTRLLSPKAVTMLSWAGWEC